MRGRVWSKGSEKGERERHGTSSEGISEKRVVWDSNEKTG